jgi:molybdopterin synthase catalytic subunit
MSSHHYLHGIERRKQIVPVWKKEPGPNREDWVEGDYLLTDTETSYTPTSA